MRPIFRLSLIVAVPALALSWLAACVGDSSIKPSETLDERTGMTVGTLDKPLELIQDTAASAAPNRRLSFAYLGPVEWDNMGKITYGLWIHVAPGVDWQFGDIRAPGAVSLSLDNATTPLRVIEPPALGHAPYRPVASWGETAYFGIDLDVLRRMAASRRIALEVKAGDSVVDFSAAPDAHETLTRYLHARGY